MGTIVYVFIWVVVLMDRFFEGKGFGSYRRKIVIKTNKIIQEEEVKQVLKPLYNNKLVSIDINKEINTMTISYLIETHKKEISEIVRIFHDMDWVASCKIE